MKSYFFFEFSLSSRAREIRILRKKKDRITGEKVLVTRCSAIYLAAINWNGNGSNREPSREDAINNNLDFTGLENGGVPFANNFNNNFSKVATDWNRHPIQTAPGNNN